MRLDGFYGDFGVITTAPSFIDCKESGGLVTIGCSSELFPPDRRAKILSLTPAKDCTDARGWLNAILDALPTAPTAREVQQHRTEFNGNSQLTLSAHLGFEKAADASRAVESLKSILGARHVFLTKPRNYAVYFSLRLLTQLIPLLVLGCARPVLPDGDEPAVVHLGFWCDAAGNTSYFKVFLVGALFGKSRRSHWKTLCSSQGHEKKLLHHNQFQVWCCTPPPPPFRGAPIH